MQSLRGDSARPLQTPTEPVRPHCFQLYLQPWHSTGLLRNLGALCLLPTSPAGGCLPPPWPERSGCSPHQVIWRCPQHLCCWCWQEACEACLFKHSRLNAYFSRAAWTGDRPLAQACRGSRNSRLSERPEAGACPCEEMEWAPMLQALAGQA